jgi:hypothetical protein
MRVGDTLRAMLGAGQIVIRPRNLRPGLPGGASAPSPSLLAGTADVILRDAVDVKRYPEPSHSSDRCREVPA